MNAAVQVLIFGDKQGEVPHCEKCEDCVVFVGNYADNLLKVIKLRVWSKTIFRCFISLRSSSFVVSSASSRGQSVYSAGLPSAIRYWLVCSRLFPLLLRPGATAASVTFTHTAASASSKQSAERHQQKV